MAARQSNPAISARPLDDMLFAGRKLNVKLLGGAQQIVDG
jgi:hypothetical protein